MWFCPFDERRCLAISADHATLASCPMRDDQRVEKGVVEEMGMRSLSTLIEQHGNIRRLAEHMVKAAKVLAGLFVIADVYKKHDKSVQGLESGIALRDIAA